MTTLCRADNYSRLVTQTDPEDYFFQTILAELPISTANELQNSADPWPAMVAQINFGTAHLIAAPSALVKSGSTVAEGKSSRLEVELGGGKEPGTCYVNIKFKSDVLSYQTGRDALYPEYPVGKGVILQVTDLPKDPAKKAILMFRITGAQPAISGF